MKKLFFTYFLVSVLLTSIALPTYVSLLELSYEVEFAIDLEEESEDVELTKDTELKIVNFNTSFLTYTYTTNQKSVIHFSKKYTSIFQNLDSPPPEIYS
ncbi:hypothetical protein [Tenacibaculum agarivorans]|uniref:hypothetical protein n=1 Tax=Tenacibaculum agarivorans TaxID=1908389 RepID=UPI00094BA4F3|nr:hypothetical protein [Tenacibaculum agarivorans]